MWPTLILDSDFVHQTWKRLSFHNRSTRRLVIVRFQSWRPESVTVCHRSSRHLHHCHYSSGDWGQSFSHARTLPLDTDRTQVASNLCTSLVFILSRDLEVPLNCLSILPFCMNSSKLTSLASNSATNTFKLATLIHHSFLNAGPGQYLSSLRHSYMPSRQLRSASLNLLSQPRINIALASRSFRYDALLFGIPPSSSKIYRLLHCLQIQSKNSPFLWWIQHLWPLAIHIHALLIRHNHVDFLCLEIILCYVMLSIPYFANII